VKRLKERERSAVSGKKGGARGKILGTVGRIKLPRIGARDELPS